MDRRGQAIFDANTLRQTRARSAERTILFYKLQAGRPCSHSMKEALKSALKSGRHTDKSGQSPPGVEWHAEWSKISGSPTKEILESMAQASYNIQKGKMIKLIAK